MLSPEEIEARLERVLLTVQKPARYVGGEYNAVVKDWESVRTRLAFVFPDVYEIGLSNLGLQILYDAVNQRSDALAERAYAPWPDMEAAMRAHGIPLYSLESKRPLAGFDILGFSIPYETLYTNVLNLLDLAGLPLFAAERDERHPLVIAGGHACFNPEPMHAFMDAFAIGEGEEVIHDILEVVGRWKEAQRPRAELLRALARIPGVYVPSLYQVRYFSDGTVQTVEPLTPEAPPVIVKRMVPKLPPPVTDFLVPNTDIVHNRVAIEIMRGCTRGCRFCQAGMVMRPVRERPIGEIVRAAEEAVANTGYEELALLSLSSSDYSDIIRLVESMGERFQGRHLTISLPSLRIETVSVDLMERLKERRSGGFTLAPEAATERMRRIINKFIPDEQILATAREIYRRGWTTIKLYFMIGHPAETLEDVQAIADLCRRILAEGRRVLGGRAHLHVGVSTFIPKPHTPFQWATCDTPEQIQAKQNWLKQALRDRAIKLTWTAPEETLLEAWLSRGDRRLAGVIYHAWQHGARFDAWQDLRRMDLWQAAFAATGLDPAFYTHRPRRPDEIFPWDHISVGVHKRFLWQDYRLSLEEQTRADCRTGCYACGILSAYRQERRAHPGDFWKCPTVKTRAPRQA